MHHSLTRLASTNQTRHLLSICELPATSTAAFVLCTEQAGVERASVGRQAVMMCPNALIFESMWNLLKLVMSSSRLAPSSIALHTPSDQARFEPKNNIACCLSHMGKQTCSLAPYLQMHQEHRSANNMCQRSRRAVEQLLQESTLDAMRTYGSDLH